MATCGYVWLRVAIIVIFMYSILLLLPRYLFMLLISSLSPFYFFPLLLLCTAGGNSDQSVGQREGGTQPDDEPSHPLLWPAAEGVCMYE